MSDYSRLSHFVGALWRARDHPDLKVKLEPQALEVMAINHKNNASNKCLYVNTM